jgi:hypothetical protein
MEQFEKISAIEYGKFENILGYGLGPKRVCLMKKPEVKNLMLLSLYME